MADAENLQNNDQSRVLGTIKQAKEIDVGNSNDPQVKEAPQNNITTNKRTSISFYYFVIPFSIFLAMLSEKLKGWNQFLEPYRTIGEYYNFIMSSLVGFISELWSFAFESQQTLFLSTIHIVAVLLVIVATVVLIRAIIKVAIWWVLLIILGPAIAAGIFFLAVQPF